MMYPKVLEDQEKIVVIYSDEVAVDIEEDDGVVLYYNRDGRIVKIIIKKDEKHNIIYF